jgi:RNA polymerase sigma-70 factor (ECF subfamily)
LVAAARSGDRGATDQLLRLHYDRVLGVCRRVTGNDADAADAAQNALIAIVRGLPRFDGRSAFGSWAYRIATNASLDELRRRKRRGAVGLPEDDAMLTDPAEQPLDLTVTDRVAVDRALDLLPTEFRVPVVLRDLLDLDYAEIADTLGIPPGTVRSRISRGRAALAKILVESPPGGNPAPTTERQNEQP